MHYTAMAARPRSGSHGLQGRDGVHLTQGPGSEVAAIVPSGFVVAHAATVRRSRVLCCETPRSKTGCTPPCVDNEGLCSAGVLREGVSAAAIVVTDTAGAP